MHFIGSIGPRQRSNDGEFFLVLRRATVSVALLLLSGCAIAPKEEIADGPPVPPYDAARLARLDTWHVNGRAAILTENESWQAQVNWRQSGATFDIALNTPIGTGAARISGDDLGASLVVGNETAQYAANIEELMERQLGWRLPLEYLRYWVRGLTAPVVAVEQRDGRGRLERLEQQGWVVEYRRYTEVDGLELPEKIFLTSHGLEVRLVVSEWTIAEP